MPDIHLQRDHALGLAKARKLAFQWAEQAEERLDMECTYVEGKTEDEVRFERSGASGTLRVTKDCFELDAKLGFLLGAFKERIESEIVKNLDALIEGTSIDELAAGAKDGAKKGAKAAPAKAPAAAPAKAARKKSA